MIKTRGIGDEPCGSVLSPLQLVKITGWLAVQQTVTVVKASNN